MATVAPVRRANLVVVRKWIGCGVRRRQHLDAELLEQRPRQELRAPQLLGDLVVDALGALAVEPLANAEDLVQLV